MEKFLLKLDLGKMCLLGSSFIMQLVPIPSLPHYWAKFITTNIKVKGALSLSYGGCSNESRDVPF